MHGKEIEDLLILQQDLFRLTDETFDETIDHILSTNYPYSDHGVYALAANIKRLVIKQPKKVDLLADLITTLFNLEGEEYHFQVFDDAFLKINDDCTVMRLVRKLIKNGVIPPQKIIDITLQPDVGNVFIFIFFADYIKASYDNESMVEPYEAFRDRIFRNPQTNFPNYNYMIIEMIRNWEKYEADNFKLLEPIYEVGWFTNTLQYHIIFDDIKFLEDYAKSNVLNPMMRIELDEIYSNQFSTQIVAEKTLPEFAAFWGSTKCFKFLLSCGATITEEMLPIILSGGSLEIAQICAKMNLNFTNGYKHLISFYHLDLFDWYCKEFPLNTVRRNDAFKIALQEDNLKTTLDLLEKYPIDLSNEHIPEWIVTFECLELIKMFIDKGINFCNVESVKIATRSGNGEILKYLIEEIKAPIMHPLNLPKEQADPLFTAVKYQWPEIVKILLEAGADPNATYRNLTVLSFASGRPNSQIVQLLCEYGARVNYSLTKYTDLPIIRACRVYLENVKVLIGWGAEYDVQTVVKVNRTTQAIVKRHSPLCAACDGGALDIVQFLINNGCDPNECESEPLETARNQNYSSICNYLTQWLQTNTKTLFNNLIIAIKQKSLENVRVLIAKGVDLTTRDDNNKTVGHHAARSSHEVLEFIISAVNGQGLNARDSEDKTPLHHALEAKLVDNVALFLENGVNIDMLTNQGYSCLRIAVENLDFDAARMIMERNVDPNVEDFNGITPLIAACRKPKSPDRLRMIEFLISSGADTRMADSQNYTPLHTLILHHPTLSELELLTKSMKNINSFSRKGMPMMGDAVRLETILFEFLLLNGGDRWAATSKGETLLHIAAETNHIRNAELLISFAGLSAKKRSRWLRTPIFNAVKGAPGEPVNILRSMTMIDLLLANGASINDTDSKKNTPVIALFERRDYIPVEYIKILKEKYKANMYKRNEVGVSVLVRCEVFHRQDIINYLDPQEGHPLTKADVKIFNEKNEETPKK